MIGKPTWMTAAAAAALLACWNPTVPHPGTPCTTEADCGDGLVCDMEADACRVPADAPCEADEDCVTGLFCDQGTGRCTGRAIDQPCDPEHRCADPLVCEWTGSFSACHAPEGYPCDRGGCTNELVCLQTSHVCGPAHSGGDACAATSDCVRGLHCDLAVGACVGQAANASCGPTLPCQPPLFCQAELCKLPEGAACQPGECADGLTCLGTTRTCAPPQPVHAHCVASIDCDTGLHCNLVTQQCEGQSVNEACGPDLPCEGNLLCDGQQCLVPEAGACHYDVECAAGLVCNATSSACLPPGDADATCTRDVECAAPLTCDGGRCLGGDLLEACDSSHPCRSGLSCVAGFCRALDGHPCIADVECASGTCCGHSQCTPETTCYPPIEVCNGIDDDDDGLIDEDPACLITIDLRDILLAPLFLIGGDGEFDGHGPRVTVDVVISRTPDAVIVQVWVDMIETRSDWTHGIGYHEEQYAIRNSAVLADGHFHAEYTDDGHSWDNVAWRAEADTYDPSDAVAWLLCVGDTSGDDVCTNQLPPDCSGCFIQFAPVVVRRSPP